MASGVVNVVNMLLGSRYDFCAPCTEMATSVGTAKSQSITLILKDFLKNK